MYFAEAVPQKACRRTDVAPRRKPHGFQYLDSANPSDGLPGALWPDFLQPRDVNGHNGNAGFQSENGGAVLELPELRRGGSSALREEKDVLPPAEQPPGIGQRSGPTTAEDENLDQARAITSELAVQVRG